MPTDRVQLYDTTLRDGSQMEGISLSVEDKVRITRKLDELGLEWVEGGFPGSNPKDAEYFRRLKSIELRNAKVSAFGGTRKPNLTCETDANIQPGDSGGPLLDSSGNVIGMDTAASGGFALQYTGNEAFAIPINRALSIARQIEAGHSLTAHIGATAFLGVEVAAGDYFTRGAVVAGVVHSSPAARAGLTYGDVIVTVNGRTVTSPTTLTALLLKQAPGAKIQIHWIDQFGTSHTAHVTLASGPAQ